MAKRFAQHYPTLAALAERGVHIEVNGGGYYLQIAGLFDEDQMICQFECAGLKADQIFENLEKLAVRYEEEGIATDVLNGCEHQLW